MQKVVKVMRRKYTRVAYLQPGARSRPCRVPSVVVHRSFVRVVRRSSLCVEDVTTHDQSTLVVCGHVSVMDVVGHAFVLEYDTHARTYVVGAGRWYHTRVCHSRVLR